jgi:hypothetical protein
MKRIIREKLNIVWQHLLFDEEGFRRHHETCLKLARLGLPNGATIRAGVSGPEFGQQNLYFAIFGLTEEAAPLYEQMMADVSVEEYVHQDVDEEKV